MTQTEVRTPASQWETAESGERLSLDDFQEMLRESDITPTPLEVTQRRFSSDARTGRRPVFRLTWPRRRRFRLFGLWTKEWNGRKSGSFIKCYPHEITMPVEAEVISARVKDRPEVEEAAVFVETRIDPILAVRVEGRWLELYRWFTRPTFLRDGRETARR